MNIASELGVHMVQANLTWEMASFMARATEPRRFNVPLREVIRRRRVRHRRAESFVHIIMATGGLQCTAGMSAPHCAT